jgi:hypothetical protein
MTPVAPKQVSLIVTFGFDMGIHAKKAKMLVLILSLPKGRAQFAKAINGRHLVRAVIHQDFVLVLRTTQ